MPFDSSWPACGRPITRSGHSPWWWLAMSEPGGSPTASCKASRMVRKKGLEPSRPCGRQPLKLVRLPIPPLPRGVTVRWTLWITRPAGYQPKDKYTADPWRRQPRSSASGFLTFHDDIDRRKRRDAVAPDRCSEETGAVQQDPCVAPGV